MRILFTLVLLVSFSSVAQQERIDSLSNIVATTKNDSLRLAVNNQILWSYLFSDKEKAIQAMRKSERMAKKPGQAFGYISLLGIKGVFFDVNGVPDSALFYFKKMNEFSKKHHFLVHEANSLNNLGMYSWNRGKYEDALDYFFKSIKVRAKLPIDKGGDLSSDYNNIGLIYQEMELYPQALAYHKKAFDLRKKRNHSRGLIASYDNLGICQVQLKKYDQAKGSYEAGIKLAEKIDDQIGYFKLQEGLAGIYFLQGDKEKALAMYLGSLKRPENVPLTDKTKARLYGKIANVYIALNQAKNAINYGEMGVKLIDQDSTIITDGDIYKWLAQAYYMTGNQQKGSAANDKFYAYTVAKFQEANAEAIQELEIKYETEKKENALVSERMKVAEKDLSIQRKNNWLLLSGVGLFFLLIISFLLVNRQKLKHKKLVRERELSDALFKIEANNRLQEQRLEISRDLHDTIGTQLTFIISSLDNLRYAMKSENPIVREKLSQIGGFTRETIFELRDTIWAMNKTAITAEDLNIRLSNFIHNAKVSLETIEFNFNAVADTTQVLSSKEGMNCYRIIQEAVNNAVKHAEASKIDVAVKIDAKVVAISIKDNGSGFDVKNTIEGNGIHSMTKRTEELNGEIKLISSGDGTTIEVDFSR